MTSNTYKITVRKRTVNSGFEKDNIYITLYGEQGNSGEIYLGNEVNKSTQENVDVFTINLQPIESITKIRIRYVNGDPKHRLILTSVLLDEEKTGKEWVCSRNRWVADNEDNSSLVRELQCSKV